MRVDKAYKEWIKKGQETRIGNPPRCEIFHSWGRFKSEMKRKGSETPYHAMGHVFGNRFKELIDDEIRPLSPEEDTSLFCGECGIHFNEHQANPVPCVRPIELNPDRAKSKYAGGRKNRKYGRE